MDPIDPREAWAGTAGEEPDDGDALDHLWTAAHEMLRAMRLLLDAADEFVEQQRGARPASASGGADARDGRVQHIDIDVHADPAAARDADRHAYRGADRDAAAH